MAIAVVVDKAAARSPAIRRSGQSGFQGHIREGTVTIVVIKRVSAPIADEQVIEAVVIVITYAAALTPSGARETSLLGDVCERAVAIIVKEVTGGLARAGREA